MQQAIVASDRAATQPVEHNSALPATGFVRLPTVAAVAGIGRSTIWKWCAQGRMPAPVKLSPRVSAWPVAALREWLADPAGWQEAQVQKVGT